MKLLLQQERKKSISKNRLINCPANKRIQLAGYQYSHVEYSEMPKLTRGYPFAFQILGYLRWEKPGSLDDIMPQFDELLTTYAYEKIWSELHLALPRFEVYINTYCDVVI